MGSSVSSISKTKIILTASQKQSSSGRINKECTDNFQFSSNQCQMSTDIPCHFSNSTEVPTPSDNSELSSNQKSGGISEEAINWEKQANDDNVVRTEKNKDDENIKTVEEMTDEDLEKFRKGTFDFLRETALKVVALKFREEQNREFLTNILNVGNIFNDSCFALEETARANVEQFRRDIAQLMMETKYFSLSCVIVMHTYKGRWHLEDNDLYQNIPHTYMKTLQAYSIASDDFATAMANEPGFVKIVKQMIEDCLPKYFAKENMFKLAESEEEIIEAALALAYHMSLRESNVSKLRDAGMIACLQPYLKSPNNEHALLALACLAGIINEKECDIINSNKQIVMYLLDCIRRGLKDKMRICEEGWYCQECCLTVKLLARNDANMKTLVELGALELLVELGKIGDEDEQYKSVSALWALCFAKESKKLITENPILGVVDLLVKLKSSENEKIRKACNGALWTLRGEPTGAKGDIKETRQEKERQVTLEDKISSKGHVMISYQWADQEVVKKIRNNIILRGYKVWMDIDQMEGSSLQAMANAVESAEVVLMCLSNKYKYSTSCRAEAEYAFQQRKHIIPLRMERGYVPDGWLGFLVGGKLFYDFSGKYPFEDKMNGLLKDIDGILGGPGDMPDSGEINTPQVTEEAGPHTVSHADTASSVSNTVARISISETTIDNMREWSADDVKTWIERNSLQNCRISTFTGGEIAELANMYLEYPEFFYNCLKDMLNIKDLLTISKVVLALHNLS